MHETDYQSILNDIRETIQQCGTLARDAFYSQAPGQPVSGKASIDVVIERKLHEALTARTPQFGFISEECPELATAPTDHASHYWLVDPNDGTKPFQEGYRGASISVALIRGDRPVLGLVYAYAARCGVGDFYEWSEGGALRRNGLYVQWQRSHPVALVSNNAELKNDLYRGQFAPLRYQPAPGIAYRLALAATGQGAVAVSLGNPRDLDIAGGHALLIGAGLDLFGQDGTPLRYGYGHQRVQSPVIGGRFEDCSPFFGRLSLPKPEAQGAAPPWRITPNPAELCDRPHVLDRLTGAFMGVLLADCLATVPDLLMKIETLP
ncbi:MAG: inositol monophosphatase family protein, partial [Bradymonadia bacterium]